MGQMVNREVTGSGQWSQARRRRWLGFLLMALMFLILAVISTAYLR